MKPARTQPLPRCDTKVAVPLPILDAILRDEALLELRQAFVNVADMFCCTDGLLATVVAVAESQFTSRMVTRTMVSTCLFFLLLDPPRKATDPRFEFHVAIASNQRGGNERGDVMLVPMFFMAILPKPMTDFAISLAELTADGTTMPEPPEGLLQLPVSVNFLFVKP